MTLNEATKLVDDLVTAATSAALADYQGTNDEADWWEQELERCKQAAIQVLTQPQIIDKTAP